MSIPFEECLVGSTALGRPVVGVQDKYQEDPDGAEKVSLCELPGTWGQSDQVRTLGAQPRPTSSPRPG
jgi:hypothetical protein